MCTVRHDELEDLSSKYNTLKSTLYAIKDNKYDMNKVFTQLFENSFKLSQEEMYKSSDNNTLYIPSFVNLRISNIKVRNFETRPRSGHYVREASVKTEIKPSPTSLFKPEPNTHKTELREKKDPEKHEPVNDTVPKAKAEPKKSSSEIKRKPSTTKTVDKSKKLDQEAKKIKLKHEPKVIEMEMDDKLFDKEQLEEPELSTSVEQPSKIKFVEKVSKENTYIENGYFVVEESEDYVEVVKDVKNNQEGIKQHSNGKLKESNLPKATNGVDLKKTETAKSDAKKKLNQSSIIQLSSNIKHNYHGRNKIYLENDHNFDSKQTSIVVSDEIPTVNRNIVSIVGRPNVGKSSVFNRITKLFHYGSVVSDVPGTTRDRQYSIADWNGKQFRIVDTGGYDDEQMYSDEIREHIDMAIKESSAIIFVVDGIEGLTTKDIELRDYLFRHKKKRDFKILLCVNKCESYRRGDMLAQDFWKLGLGQPYPVSALHGSGLAELLDNCVEDFSPGEIVEESHIVVSFIGRFGVQLLEMFRPNSGKSSLLNKLVGKNRCIVSPEEGTTQDSTKVLITHDGTKMSLIDTAGMKLLTKDRRSYLSQKSSLKSIRQSDVCLLVIDSSWGISKNDVRMAEEIKQENKAAIIVCNKWDLVTKNPSIYANVTGYIRDKITSLSYAEITMTSAKSGQRVQGIFDLVQKVYKNYCANLPTNLINQTIKEAMFNRKLPVTHGKRLNIYYATQVHSKPPGFALFCNDSLLMTDDYKQYLEEFIRNSFNLTGTPIMLYPRSRRRRDIVDDIPASKAPSTSNNMFIL
ncbi:hypothetical protein MACJ_002016 [Theileria orientalis]|uniref:GTPase Der n=1 Tax=Theileria orientalis TaxID=68886 RepID=A0A976QQA0_THEOR|nr:hypothetical protein MACJ_002016 [Theileria orientalis]